MRLCGPGTIYKKISVVSDGGVALIREPHGSFSADDRSKV